MNTVGFVNFDDFMAESDLFIGPVRVESYRKSSPVHQQTSIERITISIECAAQTDYGVAVCRMRVGECLSFDDRLETIMQRSEAITNAIWREFDIKGFDVRPGLIAQAADSTTVAPVPIRFFPEETAAA